MSRQLTERERAVLDTLLAVDFDGVQRLRDGARSAVVVGGCDCGCPSIDFHNEPGIGMHIHVNAGVQGSLDGLFLYSVGVRLGGIEWVGNSDQDDPAELPDPCLLIISTASG